MKARTKYSAMAVVMLVLFAAGCSQNPTDPVANDTYGEPFAAAKPVFDEKSGISYEAELVNHVYDGVNTTFTYSFTSNPEGGPAISHITLAVGECAVGKIAGSNDPAWSFVNPDPTTGVTGVKFDTGYKDRETRTVTLVLSGEYSVGVIPFAVKAGNGYTTGLIQGPAGCRENETTYTISGVVYFDADGDGVRGAGEAGIGGVTVVLSNGATAVTDANGAYAFTVVSGEYTVSWTVPAGFNATTPASAAVTVANAGQTVDFGAGIDLTYLNGKSANGYTIGYWKNNIDKALEGKTRGVQVSAATLNQYFAMIVAFGLEPFTFGHLREAEATLSANGSNEIVLLKKQLLASQFNFMSGAYIDGNELYTRYFVLYGEYMIVNADRYSRGEILTMKDLYDAYNNSHGANIAL